MNKWFKFLYFFFLFISLTVNAAVTVESNDFTLSGIETEFKVKGIDTVLNRPFQYKITSGSKTLSSGVTNPENGYATIGIKIQNRDKLDNGELSDPYFKLATLKWKDTNEIPYGYKKNEKIRIV